MVMNFSIRAIFSTIEVSVISPEEGASGTPSSFAEMIKPVQDDNSDLIRYLEWPSGMVSCAAASTYEYSITSCHICDFLAHTCNQD